MAGTVRVDGGGVRVDGWATERPEVVRWFEEQLAGDDAPDAEELLEHVAVAGVLALRTARVAVDADFVAREVERLMAAVDATMSDHGERLDAIFDPNRSDSVIAAIREVMAEHVDGRDSKMARLLDLSHDGSPLRALVDEVAKVREQLEGYRRDLEARDAADEARADEHELGTAKGRAFEDEVVDALSPIAAVCGDTVEPVGDVAGCVGGSKAGDVVITLNGRDTRGLPVRVGVEVKNRTLNAKTTREQLDATKANRDAVAAIAVFAREEQMPKGTWPFAELGENRFACLVDTDDGDVQALTLAYRLARHWALVDSAADGAEVDLRAMHDALDHARNQLQSFTVLKRKITSLESGFADGVSGIRAELDRARVALTDAFDRLDEAILDDGDASAAA